MQKNVDPHKKPIPLLNMVNCTQSMQRTWWPVASSNIVIGSYLLIITIYPAASARKTISIYTSAWCNTVQQSILPPYSRLDAVPSVCFQLRLVQIRSFDGWVVVKWLRRSTQEWAAVLPQTVGPWV